MAGDGACCADVGLWCVQETPGRLLDRYAPPAPGRCGRTNASCAKRCRYRCHCHPFRYRLLLPSCCCAVLCSAELASPGWGRQSGNRLVPDELYYRWLCVLAKRRDGGGVSVWRRCAFPVVTGSMRANQYSSRWRHLPTRQGERTDDTSWTPAGTRTHGVRVEFRPWLTVCCCCGRTSVACWVWRGGMTGCTWRGAIQAEMMGSSSVLFCTALLRCAVSLNGRPSVWHGFTTPGKEKNSCSTSFCTAEESPA